MGPDSDDIQFFDYCGNSLFATKASDILLTQSAVKWRIRATNSPSSSTAQLFVVSLRTYLVQSFGLGYSLYIYT